MAHQAIYLSRTSAHKAIISEGRRLGIPDQVIAKHGRAVHATKRGQSLGYVAFCPISTNGHTAPILED